MTIITLRNIKILSLMISVTFTLHLISQIIIIRMGSLKIPRLISRVSQKRKRETKKKKKMTVIVMVMMIKNKMKKTNSTKNELIKRKERNEQNHTFFYYYFFNFYNIFNKSILLHIFLLFSLS